MPRAPPTCFFRPIVRCKISALCNKQSSHYSVLHYTTLHYTTWHYITLHYMTLHYITWHYTTLHYITLHFMTLYNNITLHYISLHFITHASSVWTLCNGQMLTLHSITHNCNTQTIKSFSRQSEQFAHQCYHWSKPYIALCTITWLQCILRHFHCNGHNFLMHCVISIVMLHNMYCVNPSANFSWPIFHWLDSGFW